MASTRVAGLMLGLGIGGFADGIVLHQLLGWHHMLTGWYPHDDRLNMIGDGLFHLGCLVLVCLGIAALARIGPVSGRELTGWIITGWGVFNVVEGIIDRQLLGVHHVRHGPDQLLWDLGFLGFGAALIVAGLVLARRVAPSRV
ncbi:DUF2243 domain-containing protein [Thermoactinospora rubra]|uniref:DUF2243 domain-containing protein n=1 Tax=Thermoactinospora rubra TaxID=1088767 RepID=UPI000A10E65D|nr:DUF2243 domain-containing protein [Thermoactinospora rubra]